ncbi:nitroreductase family protein [Shewanella sp. FJAT-52076]|uniref:nitroreductase family protein n=1 Tax=Shewanella sp. FJAT-52076 TaxID=2864202 RepID=UPI001C65CA09|nr:nitroreductase family protein [Shewanella sp. FJAT-52076]QYJ74046.1 nitroreductase family protein [Shewanella sp. FJAT-52076]
MKALLRRLLGEDTRRTLRSMFNRIDMCLLQWFASAPLKPFANVFYGVLNGEFSREHRAVIAGRKAYQASHGLRSGSAPMLRRNIHRIEKGLSMSPRRSVFAEDYIQETVSIYLDAIQNGAICKEELGWARDVLSRYFQIVEPTSVVANARLHFSEQESKSATKVPYTSEERQGPQVDFVHFMALCRQRRSVRWYQPKPVPDNLIDQAIGAASQAPSACNRQAFRFFVANDANLAPRIAAMAGGTAGFSDNIPCVLVVVGDLSAYAAERDRHLIYIDGALASMQLMLALETLGLASCPINWPDLEVPEAKMAKRLGLAEYERPVMLISVGYALETGMIPFSQKKPVSQLRIDITP